ncbi:MAG: DUF1192 domain-containing protein [Micavibrio sp.]|nr:DUF1192 domain-containing protein [Micavibrio sp.]
MFDDERPKAKTNEFPRELVGLSIDELQDYIADLKAEIARAESDILKKKETALQASSIFKS